MTTRSKFVLAATLAALLIAALSVTALAEAMVGPDEVYEGGNVEMQFNSPADGGMEGHVTTSDNLTFQGITSVNMGSSISTEEYVFSLFGDPVTYSYCVSASAGDRVSVSLTEAEQSDAEGNLTQLADQTWSKTVQASPSASTAPGTPSPSPGPSGSASAGPGSQQTPGPGQSTEPSPSYDPGPAPSGAPVRPAANVSINIENTNTNVNQSQGASYDAGYVPVRYPSYAPVLRQRPAYRTNDGMPKMGDEGSYVQSYGILLTLAALLTVVVLVAAYQVWSHSAHNRRTRVVILR